MRLLILKCSSRKRGPAEPTPALERYDGPLWQVLRSYLREQPLLATDLTVYGLSAEYGLIRGDEPIPLYDRTMDSERADALRPAVLRALPDVLGAGYEQLCLGLSQRYLRAMEGWQALLPAATALTVTDGAMGEKLGQLRAWLEGRAWAPATDRPARLVAPEAPRGAVTLAGVHIQMTRDEVLTRARDALVTDGIHAGRFRDWYVLVDDRPVAAKWLAGLLTGLPTTRFDAANARRALLALGIDVERVV